MPLTEVVVLTVGSAIAKQILKLWLKDTAIGADIPSDLIDILKSKTSDALAQRRGQRQFESIGEKVGESLTPLFEAEGSRRLDEGSRTAIAIAVAETLNASKLSAEILTKHNLEPKQLARYVLAYSPATTKQFSEAEGAFYYRIIEESCTYIVDIASQLPTFTERTFADVLKREDQLLARTDEILREMQRVRADLNTLVGNERFEIDYRLSVARKLDEIQLIGADVSLASRRHQLSVAYITLSATLEQEEQKEIEQRLEQDEAHFAPVSSDYATQDTPKDQKRPKNRAVFVDSALANSHRLLIRGAPGSGKTTLLQWVAVRAATRSFEGLLNDWNAKLPFYIRLRQQTQSELPRPEEFPGLVAPAIADTMPKGWVHKVLTDGQALLLVDGLDEVSKAKREAVRDWLKDLANSYPLIHILVTSRPHAIDEGWIDLSGFSTTELLPMQLSDITLFIDHWHEAVEEELHTNEEKTELVSLAANLKSEIRQNRALRNLAVSPLLCAMLCALNRDRRQQIPKDRIELYKECCTLLIERRDAARLVDLTDYPATQLHARQKRHLLEDLAYWMIKNEQSEVSTETVDRRFSRDLTTMPSVSSQITGPDVRKLFTERTGIIQQPIATHIDFVHRTFQEFLAAQAAVDDEDTGMLIANAHNPQWREVLISACGLATFPMRRALVTGLINRGDREKKYRHQLHLLAVACLETSIDLDPELIAKVEKRLNQLVPPQNTTDAMSIASAGELAIKYLSYIKEYSTSAITSCIRALALIGGDTAITALESYTGDPRPEIKTALLNAWDSFERKGYAKRVLSQALKDAKELRLNHLSSLEGIEHISQLSTLNISGTQISDLTPLVGLSQLSTLDISGTQVSDLTPLVGLSQLSTLYMYETRVSDLTPLEKLSNLNIEGLSMLKKVNKNIRGGIKALFRDTPSSS